MSPPIVRNGNDFIHMGTQLLKFYNRLFMKNKVLDSEASFYVQKRTFRAK
jgi:hypothetical protein